MADPNTPNTTDPNVLPTTLWGNLGYIISNSKRVKNTVIIVVVLVLALLLLTVGFNCKTKYFQVEKPSLTVEDIKNLKK